MKFKFIIYFIIFFVGSIFIQAQNNKELIGQVIDSETNHPISYVTIRFNNSSRGIIGNADGDFRIPKSLEVKYKFIAISCIGYETTVVQLNTFKVGIINKILVKPKVELLDNVIIFSNKKKKKKYLSAYSLVKKAIQKIPENSNVNPYSMIGYYRDYSLVEGKYYNVNEALIKTFDAGYDTDYILGKKNQDVLLYYETNKNFPIDSSLSRTYDGHSKYIDNTDLSGQGGNELGILKIHDPIRNYKYKSFSFVNVLKSDFLNNHEFTSVETTQYNNEKLKIVRFVSKFKISGSKHQAKGEVYISEDNFRIYKFHYQVREKKNSKKTNEILATKKPDNLLYEVTADYQLVDGNMYLNYLTYNNKFTTFDDDFFDITKFEYSAKELCFYVYFNSPLKRNTVQQRDFKIRYGNNKIPVEKVKVIDDFTVKVMLIPYLIPDNWKIENPILKYLTYKVKNISDTLNRKLYKAPVIKGYHFREFFVQEINVSDSINDNYSLIDKNEPIPNAEINLFNRIDEYWVNTMLKKPDN